MTPVEVPAEDGVAQPIEDAPTGRMEQADLDRHTQVTRSVRNERPTLELAPEAIEALRRLSVKHEADLGRGERAIRSTSARGRGRARSTR